MMQLEARDLIKGLLLWIVLLVGQIAGGLLFLAKVPPFPPDGPFSAGQAMLIVAAVDAAILALLASQMGLRGPKLGLLLGILYFGVQSLQSLIEAVIFGSDVRLPTMLLLLSSAAALAKTLLAAVAIALLWRGPAAGSSRTIGNLGRKAPAIAVLYVVCYFLAGHFIAWRSAAVRDYYAHFDDIFTHVPDSRTALMLAVQLIRGLVWGALAWIPAKYVHGSPGKVAVLTGLALSAIMVPQLLFPNPIMPWPVREAHMIEVGVSNFIFGILAAFILLRRGPPAEPQERAPIAASPAAGR